VTRTKRYGHHRHLAWQAKEHISKKSPEESERRGETSHCQWQHTSFPTPFLNVCTCGSCHRSPSFSCCVLAVRMMMLLLLPVWLLFVIIFSCSHKSLSYAIAVLHVLRVGVFSFRVVVSQA
jgi:hypothetical protein